MAEQEYPDVLGAITSQGRLELDTLQCALGVFPKGLVIGQPFELLILLQSKIDQPQDVTLSFKLPRKDRSGRRLSFFFPKKQMKITLGPGETGVVHLPVMAQPPTPPTRGYPVIMKVQVNSPRSAVQYVRSPGMGRPPSALSVSSFRIAVLKDVIFSGKGDAPDSLVTRFDVLPGQVAPGLSQPAAKYEILWEAKNYTVEQDRLAGAIAEAERFASEFSAAAVLIMLDDATQDRFSQAGLPLHPGESLFIAKMMAYTFEEGMEREKGFTLSEARWFQWLCSLMARDETTSGRDPGELAAYELYEGALYDAVCIGLPMVQAYARESYGSREEHRQYAEKVAQAMQGNIPVDISYVYLPLIMGGVLLNYAITLRYDNPWEHLDMLREALGGRSRLIGSGMRSILETLDKFMDDAEKLLQRSRVPRP